MRRPQKYISLSLWLGKVKRFQESGEPGAIVRVIQEGEEGEDDITEDASLDDVERKVPGLYHLVDQDGDTVAKCRIGAGGERMMLPARRSLASEAITRRAANEMAAAGQIWGDLATYQGAAIKDKDQELKEARAEIATLQKEVMKLTIALETGDEDEENEWIPLIQQGIDVVAGRGIKERIKESAIAILKRALEGEVISAEQAAALTLIANEELSKMQVGMQLHKAKENEA